MSYGITLALDGSTYAGTVALIRGLEVLAERSLPESGTPGRSGRDESFLPMLAETLDVVSIRPRDLSRVVCGGGPGSFTSLRVAASIAKGIAVGSGCPLFTVSSLALVAADCAPGRYLSTLPAMRGEVYAALYEVRADGIEERIPPAIMLESAVDDHAAREGAKVISRPHARGVAKILPMIIAGQPCDIDTWEPAYGRLAEAQVKWEAAHGRPLSTSG
jgi:tRNA threonylcarbamoyladenosine biosynthesis protein TsaB